MQELKHMITLKGIVLFVCTVMVAGNTSISFDQSTPAQTLPATSTIKKTATLDPPVVSMATQSTYSTSTMISPSRSSSLRVISGSSVLTDRTTETSPNNNKDEEEKEKEKKETALIVASCAGGATLVIGLFVITCTHRRDQKL